MLIEVIKEKKLTVIWLARNESNDPVVQTSLKPIYKRYKAIKYTVVVFYSGKQEICGLTGELLKYNRRLFAEREARASGS